MVSVSNAKDARRAAELRNLFGAAAATRLSAAAVTRAIGSRSVYTKRSAAREAAFDLMWRFEADGYVKASPGPRDGAGWSLTERGAALVRQFYGPQK